MLKQDVTVSPTGPLAEAVGLPASFYTSEHVWKAEREEVFDRLWLPAGREEEVAESGDFMQRQIAGEDLVMVRDNDGQVRADPLSRLLLVS